MNAGNPTHGCRSFSIAIQPDDYSLSPEKSDASSPRWAEVLIKAGHKVKWVNVRNADILDQLRGCHGFMWRWAHFDGMGRIARRLLPVLERELGLSVYPDQSTSWHYDDKIAQAFLLPTLGIPMPHTWVWFDAAAALDWVRTATFPLVLKLAGGAGSTNVRLLRTSDEAQLWINRLFSYRVVTLAEDQFQPLGWKRRLRAALGVIQRGNHPLPRDDGFEPQSGQLLFQEFLPNNEYDTRVTVIGKRAFGFRRFNRAKDFRASGSGDIDWNHEAVDKEFVQLAFRTSMLLKTQSCAIDGLYHNCEPVVGEISYTYASWAVHKCPGHWELHGDPTSGELEWVPGQMWPEEAQIEDFLCRLNMRSTDRRR